MRPLRLLTWNVAGLPDPEAAARVLRAARADVVCLQEVSRRAGSVYRISALARAANLLFVAGGRASAGTALLGSFAASFSDVSAFRLPVPGRPVPGRARVPRGTVVASVRLPGTAAVRVAAVHLPLLADLRLRHVSVIREALVRNGSGVVLAGDLNERPGGRAWTALSTFLDDPAPGAAPTYPARSPSTRIDVVLARGVEVAAYDVERFDQPDVARASDHRPVLTEIALLSS
ncbi:endonuclease/exonuclease/phosphatase family protein [Spongisporangium articulatum]|uniref:Endonuclease/exonuclease/phosphatase family protein n=1 Tax=Spongisporangium articulatum TaxID=3362603 RepID=A0ABW8ASV0_9ACTN